MLGFGHVGLGCREREDCHLCGAREDGESRGNRARALDAAIPRNTHMPHNRAPDLSRQNDNGSASILERILHQFGRRQRPVCICHLPSEQDRVVSGGGGTDGRPVIALNADKSSTWAR